LFAENGVFNDTILIADLPPEYVTRNSSQVVTRGNGDIAMFYAEGDVRNDTVICDIFMKRGNINQIIPVELVSFNATVSGYNITLNWMTASETNNYGFEIQRKATLNLPEGETSGMWEKIAFVTGSGTTSEIQNYSFVDYNLQTGSYLYRLKQIDFDGSINYSDIVEVNVDIPSEFSLEQNYPNPFNPTTIIKFTIPAIFASETMQSQHVSLKVYDILGKEIATLINEEKQPGVYEVEFDSSAFSSGIYFYELNSDGFSSVKKMILAK
jgi:hypothetical protein